MAVDHHPRPHDAGRPPSGSRASIATTGAMLETGSAVRIHPLDPDHAAAAAAIVTDGVRRLRASVPILPERWEDDAVVARLVAAVAQRGGGLAVSIDGQLVGFQAATLLDGHGGRWAYTADVSHGVVAGTPGSVDRTIERLYSSLAERWVREASLEHVVSVLADDADTLAAFGRLGFAPHVVDLVRNLEPIAGSVLPDGVTIRRARPADAAAMLDLNTGLVRHLRSSPVFLRIPSAPVLELQRRELEATTSATFLAVRDDRPVAYLHIGPCADDVATIVRDASTASITGAFTARDQRGDGVGTVLLDAALEWAREQGYRRMAVDHEAANGEASRFWSRHATPVVMSLARRLPPGLVS